MSIYKEPPPGMFVVPDPHDMTKVREDLELVQLSASLYVAVGGCLKGLPKRSIPRMFWEQSGWVLQERNEAPVFLVTLRWATLKMGGGSQGNWLCGKMPLQGAEELPQLKPALL